VSAAVLLIVLAAGTPLSSLEAATILDRLNAERAAAGASALRSNPALDRVARARAETVAEQSEAAAVEENGDDVSRRVREAGYEHELVEEFVTAGEGTAADRVELWRRRWPGSYAEALDGRYREAGVGAVRRGDALVSVVIVALSAADAFALRTVPIADLERVRQRMLAGVNEKRRALRLPPLRESPRLDRAAQEHAEDMIRRSYYGHQSPEGSTAMERVRRSGYRAVAVGENIAEGQNTPDEVLEGWMNSPVHREHIVSLVYREIGLGRGFGKNGRGYEIVWVQVFGMPRSGEAIDPRFRPR